MAKAALSTTERGYGHAHQVARREAVASHQQGDPCSRCGDPMTEDVSLLDLDHNDDRTGYLGLSHRACNRLAVGSRPRSKYRKVCDYCGLTFATRHEEQRFCSVPCRRTAQKAQPKRKRKPRYRAKVCPVCSAIHIRQTYCSTECRQEGNARRARDRYRSTVGLPVNPAEPTHPFKRTKVA